MCVCAHTCAGAHKPMLCVHVDVRGQLCGVTSLLPFIFHSGLNQQVPFPCWAIISPEPHSKLPVQHLKKQNVFPLHRKRLNVS